LDVIEVDEGGEAEKKDGNGGETEGREDVLDSVPHGWLPGSFSGTPLDASSESANPFPESCTMVLDEQARYNSHPSRD